MPQLNKGGKFVFGLSVIRPDLTIHIPPQALLEYGATRDGKVIIFTGSKITGGFCITTYSLLSNSKLKHILEDCPVLRDCLLSEGEFMQYKGRKYAWLAGYKPKIRFERLGTIGEGANCCDFHFIRGK